MKITIGKKPTPPQHNSREHDELAELLELEIDRKIDPHALDVACVEQSNLHFKWAEKSIKWRGEADRLKRVKDIVEAEVEIKIRKHPTVYGLELGRNGAPTEGAIKSAAQNHKEVRKAHDDWLTARDSSATYDAALASIETKRRMLEALITLHGQGYFSTPNAPRDLREAWLATKQAGDEQARSKQTSVVRKRGEKHK